MSASRTLLRKLTHIPAGTSKPGRGKRIKRGTYDRSILWKYTVDGYEFSFHATKGLRRNRVPA